MAAKLGMDDIINVGRNKKVKVSELVDTKGQIFNLIKKGIEFDDDVLKSAHIIKSNRNDTVSNVIIEHECEKGKSYEKDKESLKTILKSLNTIDNQSEEAYDEDINIEQEEENILFEEDEY